MEVILSRWLLLSGGVFSSLTLNHLFLSSLCPTVRIEKTFSFSQEITGKAEGIPERERDSVWGIRQSGLGGHRNTRACLH